MYKMKGTPTHPTVNRPMDYARTQLFADQYRDLAPVFSSPNWTHQGRRFLSPALYSLLLPLSTLSCAPKTPYWTDGCPSRSTCKHVFTMSHFLTSHNHGKKNKKITRSLFHPIENTIYYYFFFPLSVCFAIWQSRFHLRTQLFASTLCGTESPQNKPKRKKRTTLIFW